MDRRSFLGGLLASAATVITVGVNRVVSLSKVPSMTGFTDVTDPEVWTLTHYHKVGLGSWQKVTQTYGPGVKVLLKVEEALPYIEDEDYIHNLARMVEDYARDVRDVVEPRTDTNTGL